MPDTPDMGENPDELFKGAITENGARAVEEEDVVPHKSRSESEAESGDTSDLKAGLNRMFPRIPDEIIMTAARFALQAAMVARIAPDVFLDDMYLTVTDIVEMWESKNEDTLDVQEIINLVYFLLSIGLDGKGRVDIIQMLANNTESSESSSLGSALGVS